MTTTSGATEKERASAVELAVLLVLCPLAGVGAGLAFASTLVGLAVAAIGLVMVAAYALAINVRTWRRDRREDSRPLSVTDISARRRLAPEPDARATAATPEPGEAPDIAPVVATPTEPDRVVAFRAPSGRL
jgi:hypothetical protein